MTRTHDTTHDTPFIFKLLFLSIKNYLGHIKDTLRTHTIHPLCTHVHKGGYYNV